MCAIRRRCVVMFCGALASSMATGRDGGVALAADDRGGGVVVRWEDRLTLTPPAPDRSFGREVGAAGDMNGDGWPDVAVAAPGYGEGTSRVGRVFVFSGADGSLLREMRGQAGERFGVRLDAAEDVDGDGVADLGVAAVAHDPERRFVERRHLISGRTGERLYVKDVVVWDPRAEGLLEEDLSRDGSVDAADVALAVEGLARGGMRVDLDGDGVWTSVDVGRVLEAVGRVGGEDTDTKDVKRGGWLPDGPLFTCWIDPSGDDCEWDSPPGLGSGNLGIPADDDDRRVTCVCGIGGQLWTLRGQSGALLGGATLIEGGAFEWTLQSGDELLEEVTPVGPRLDYVAGLVAGEVDVRLDYHSPRCYAQAHALETLEIDDLFLEVEGCPPQMGFDEWVRLETSYFPDGGGLFWKQTSGPELTHWDENHQRLEVVTGFEEGVVRLVVRYALNGIERVRVCEFQVMGRPDRDHDGDGLSDADEVVFGTHANDADTDDDGLDDFCEWTAGTDGANAGSPNFATAPWHADTDHDGLPDFFETCQGLNPEHFDSDGDGLADGFELDHDLDPHDPDSDGDGISDFDEDEDKDNLTNDQEQSYGTDPFDADSDNDGVDDGTEVAQGSFPTNSSDGGAPLPAAEYVQVNLTIRDISHPTSVAWAYHIGPHTFLAPASDDTASATYALRVGEVYPVRLVPQGLGGVSQHFVGYAATLHADDPRVVIEDPDELLGYHKLNCGSAGSCDPAAGKEATLSILVLDLDVDSDNTEGYDAPAGDEDEEEIEDETEQELSKLVVLNIGDRDGDGAPGFADGMDLDPLSEQDDESLLDRFVPMRLTISDGFDFEKDRIAFSYSGSDPGAIVVTPREGGGAHYLAAPGALRLWLKDGAETRNPASAADEGDFVAPNVEYTAAELGLEGDEGGVIQLWVEAIEPSAALGDHRIVVTMGGVTDAVRLTAYGTRVVNLGPDGSLLETHEPVLSHPTPVIQASQLELVNVRPNEDNSRLIADLVVSGTVDDALSDLIPGGDGVISHLDVLINGRGDQDDEEAPAARIDVQFSKGGTFGQILKPHDYSGVFNAVATVDVSPGVNTVELVAQNSRGNMGFAERSFTVEVEAPPDVEVAVVASHLKGPNDLSLFLAMLSEGVPQLVHVELYINASDIYENAAFPGTSVWIEFDTPTGDPIFVINHPPFGLSQCAVGVDRTFDGDTQIVTYTGVRDVVAQERLDWTGWGMEITSATAITASSGGDFNPFVIEALGPDGMMTRVEDVTIRSEYVNALGDTVELDRQFHITTYEDNRTFLRLDGSSDPDVMLALKPVDIDELLFEQIGEWRTGPLHYLDGFGQGLADTAVSAVDSVGMVMHLGWHVYTNYGPTDIAMRISSGEGVLLEEDRASIAAKLGALRALALAAFYATQSTSSTWSFLEAIGGEEVQALGAEARLTMSYAVELLLAVSEALEHADDHELGRIHGRIVGEVAKESVLGVATAGAFNATSKALIVARVVDRLDALPNISPAAKAAMREVRDELPTADGLGLFAEPEPCNLSATIIAMVRQEQPGISHWDAFRRMLDIAEEHDMEDALAEELPYTLDALMSGLFNDALRPDGSVDPSHLVTYHDYQDFRRSDPGEPIRRLAVEGHHVAVQQWAKKYLRELPQYANLSDAELQTVLDGMPVLVLDIHDHVKRGPGIASFHSILNRKVPGNANIPFELFLARLEAAYLEWNRDIGPAVFAAAKQWYLDRGVQ